MVHFYDTKESINFCPNLQGGNIYLFLARFTKYDKNHLVVKGVTFQYENRNS